MKARLADKTPDPFYKENRLLIDLLTDNATGSTFSALKEHPPGHFRFDYFMEVSRKQRLAPLVYARMKRYGVLGILPPTAQTDLHMIYLHTLATNLACFEELNRIAATCEELHLPMLVLKGAALSQTLYEDIGLRPFNDIDILVRQKDMAHIPTLMAGLSYTLTEQYRPLEYYNKHHFHHIYIKNSGRMSCIVEVHWNLFPPSLPVVTDQDQLFDNKMVLQTKTPETYSLNWDDHFLYLCATQCFQENLRSLLYYSDLIRMVQHRLGEDSWNAIRTKAARWGLEKAVAACLHVMETRFGVSGMPRFNEFCLKQPKLAMTRSLFPGTNLFDQKVHLSRAHRSLLRLLFFNQPANVFIKNCLFPDAEDLYRHFYTIPQKISTGRSIILFVKGLKTLFQTGWLFCGLWIAVFWSKVQQKMSAREGHI